MKISLCCQNAGTNELAVETLTLPTTKLYSFKSKIFFANLIIIIKKRIQASKVKALKQFFISFIFRLGR